MLVIKWREFKNQLMEYLKEVDRLLDLRDGGENIYDVETFLIKSDGWLKRCHTYLQHSFDRINNEYAQSFITARPYNSSSNNRSKDLMCQIEFVFENLKAKRNDLNYTLRILSVSDAVIEPKFTDKKIRASYTSYEIADLILDKLYYLYDGHYYPITAILKGNSIVLSNSIYIEKVIKKLEKKGHIKTIGKKVLAGQLTMNGCEYVEERRQFKLIDKLYFVKEVSNLNVAELVIGINTTKLGKTKLMKELNDKKSLYNKLNRKNWSRLLKGKLNDLETAEVINNEAMKTIYQSMMNDDVEFL